jgi:energy-coupling factor transporter ATP-binding protein EcfA2
VSACSSPTRVFHGKFCNYLSKRWEKSEWADHVRLWYPEDDLRIEYQRDQRWYAISQGSQGQRSAALLAFLLAFGDEPIVLDQPEDDLDNHLIYDLIVRQIRENKLHRQLIIVTHNPNIVVNWDAELVHVMDFGSGQCLVQHSGALQEKTVREEVCRVMEGGREAFARRWKRLGQEV